jgi:serine/threonine protein kinase
VTAVIQEIPTMDEYPTDARIEELLLRWEDSHLRGRTLSPEELAGDCPELVAELGRRIAALRAMDVIVAPERARPDGLTPPFATTRVADLTGSVPAGGFRAVSNLVSPRFHARGGLGEVMVVRQEELDRPLALKRIRPDRFHEATRRRFLREAAITARLQHPGIVPIHGIGEDKDGPFYTMPFLRGETLQEAIGRFHRDESLRHDPGRRGLELRGLLRRFVAVCETMDYAHDQGVLHRDLKPSNIMLGPYGETMVMDWGLAKRFRNEPDDVEAEWESAGPGPSPEDMTATGAVMGTPQYMSPEQAAGRPAAPASDMYSLGVILYSILTGVSPYRESPRDDPLRPVRDAALVPPRVRAPDVPRALEAVCLKATAARPEDRYATPRALAEDLTRWLADEPVSAGREGFSARLARWARRHRAGVQAGAVALLLTAVLATIAAVVVDRARRGEQAALVKANAALSSERAAKADAEANLTLARKAVEDYFTKISENDLLKRQDAAEIRDLRPLRRELLEVALDYYDRLTRRSSADPALLADQAAASMRVGKINGEIGSKEAALGAYRRALAIRTELTATHPSDVALRRDLAASHVAVADLLGEIGRTAEALAEYDRSQGILEGLAAASPSDLDPQSELARVHNGKGIVLRELGRPTDALAELERGRVVLRRMADANSADDEDRTRLATAHSNMGLLLNELGRTDEALSALEQGRSIYRRLADAHPTGSDFQNDLAACSNNIGLLLTAADRPAEALTALKEGREILQRLVRAHPSVTGYRRDLATNYINSGNVLSATKHPSEALADFEQARAILQPLADLDPSDEEIRRNLAATLFNIGDSLGATGRFSEARDRGEQACAVIEAMRDRAPFDEYVRACAHHLCADMIDKAPGPTTSDDRSRREDHANQSVKSLRRAIANGYRAVDPRGFPALRSRPDFQDLMRDLDFPEWPFDGEPSPSATSG